MSFKSNAERLRDVLKKTRIYGAGASGNIFNFEEKRKESYARIIKTGIDALQNNEFGSIASYDRNNGKKIAEITKHLANVEKLANENRTNELIELLEKILLIYDTLNIPKAKTFRIDFGKIPADVRDEVKTDFLEMEKCLNSKCYRSAVILCGRILEICLHRKYYEITGVDALEKSPGIGLGKLVAKLIEKNAVFEPGLTQQIHLVNQVRIGSVHKKKEVFCPSNEQAQAIVLFTADIINKIF